MWVGIRPAHKIDARSENGRLVYQLRNMSSQRLTGEFVRKETELLKGRQESDLRRNGSCT